LDEIYLLDEWKSSAINQEHRHQGVLLPTSLRHENTFWRYEMALSLPGERSVAAAMPTTPLRAFIAFVAKVNADRQRRALLKSLLSMEADRLNDLGISRSDIHDAMQARSGRASIMVLNTARARQAMR
jgi:uncharacterized protein YjiS (DUF1127 family)